MSGCSAEAAKAASAILQRDNQRLRATGAILKRARQTFIRRARRGVHLSGESNLARLR